MKQDIWDQRARAVTVRMDIENGEVLEEVLEVLLGAWRGMQREVLLEEGLESMDLDLEQRSNMTRHQGNHLVTVRRKDE